MKKECPYCGAERKHKARHCGKPECADQAKGHLMVVKGNNCRKKLRNTPDSHLLCEKVRPIHLTGAEWEKHLDDLSAQNDAEAEILYAAGLKPETCSSIAADRILKGRP